MFLQFFLIINSRAITHEPPAIISRVQHQGPDLTTHFRMSPIPSEGYYFRRSHEISVLGKPADCKQGLISSTRAVKIREGQANGIRYAAWITFLRRYLPRNKGRERLDGVMEDGERKKEREDRGKEKKCPGVCGFTRLVCPLVPAWSK